MPDPFSSHGPAGVLAALPTILGERPRDRIVIVPLGPGGGDALSHALPWRGDQRTTRRVAREMAMAAAEVIGIESIIIAVFCNSISGGVSDRPYEHLQSLVTEAAHRHNIHLAESFYVAANGWGSYCCDDPRCEFAGPRPVSELEELAEELNLKF